MSGLSTNPGGPLLGRWEKPFEMLLGSATALILACIMLITCVDVAGRYVFSQPVPGALEATEIMMGALIFASLPLVTLRQQHQPGDVIRPGGRLVGEVGRSLVYTRQHPLDGFFF